MIIQIAPNNPLTGAPLTNTDLTELGVVIERMIALEAEVETITNLLEQKKEKLKQIEFTELPELFNNLGIRELALNNGNKVKLKKVYSASVSDEYPDLKKRALLWLRANNQDAIIKNEVKVPLPAGNDKVANEIRKWLDKRGLMYGVSETVHHQTIKALMKERIEAGQTFPMDIFRGFAGSKAIVEIPE